MRTSLSIGEKRPPRKAKVPRKRSRYMAEYNKEEKDTAWVEEEPTESIPIKNELTFDLEEFIC